MIDLAERTPQLLTPEQLALLGILGTYTAAIAAQHPATTDETVIELILNGHIKQLLDYRPSRGETWIIAQAQENPGLCEYLKTNASVPMRIRKAAAKLSPSAPAAPLAEPPAVPEAAAPQDTATVSQCAAQVLRPLRERLLDRRTDPEITADETAEIQATRRLWSLAARHPLLPLDLLLWLDEQRPYGEARETLLRRLEEGPLEESLLLNFAWKGTWEERAAVARNPALPREARLGLTVDPDWWVRSAAAENPNAEPEELAALAQDPDHVTIREHVASHPHASGPTLLALAGDGDHAVRLQVARNPSSPPEALSLLAGDARYAIREAVAAHPYTPSEVLDALAQDANERVQFVANLRRAPLSQAQAQQALETRRRNAKLAVAAQQAPAEMLVRLSRDRSPRVRAQVGLNPHTPSAARALLLGDQVPEVQRVAQAASPSTPGQELAALPLFDARVREGLSSNVSTPDDLLVALSDDPLRDVRLNVLLNPAAPGGALERRLPEQPMRPVIRQHPRYGQVQAKLNDLEWEEVGQPDVSAEALASLGQSDALRVRCKVASHPRTPQETLEVLVNDPEEEVRSGIISRSEELAFGLQVVLAQDASAQLRQKLLRRKDVDPNVLSVVLKASLNDGDILLSLVRHPLATPELLAELADVTRTEIREAVARDPRTPPPTLEKLTMDSQASVQRSILRNPACTPALLRQLANHRHLRLEVAHHSNTDGGTLEHLAYDAAYERFLRLERWTRRLPFGEHVLLRRWRRWSKQRASARALSDVLILSAVIVHPAATPRAVRMASRLDHPNIEQARQDRQHAARQEAHHG
ncbi:hypothetical protein [Deinococcus radiodurans]|uniref:hypothetical protein n=1 Tax=Deinococcus radiodurans TaxID=1299 RepID=UPI00140FDAA8|nr:hypothetical protein [Deinococcus radiodurans]QIP32583.1 hypothetical protein HAV35_11230 [Deinococcus radiodurans]